MSNDTPVATRNRPRGEEAANGAAARVATRQSCYVYGIVPGDVAVDGLDASMGMGSSVELVTDGPVGALVEMVDRGLPLGSRRDVVAHSAVLDEMADRSPVLPMRFGSVLESISAVVTDLLRPRAQHFAALLERVSGMHQFNVRARYVLDRILTEVVASQPDQPESGEAPSASAHETGPRTRVGWRTAQALEVRRERDCRRILETLSAHAQGYVVKDVSGIEGLARISFAVPDGERDEFELDAEVLAEEMDGRARVSLAGPMALHDFVPQD